MSKLDVIVLQYNQSKHTVRLFNSMVGHDIRVIFVDNGSEDSEHANAMWTLKATGLPHIVLRVSPNIGFPRAVNAGVGASDAPYVCIQGNDSIVYPGCYERMIKVLETRPKAGVVGPLTDACATPQKVTIMKNAWLDASNALGKTPFFHSPHDQRAQIVRDLFPGRIETLKDYVAFFCAVIPRPVWDTMGPLDPDFSPGLGEDNDYCMRLASAGYELCVAMDVYVHHVHQATLSKIMSTDDMAAAKKRAVAILKRKHGRTT